MTNDNIVEDLERRIVKTFLDVIILQVLKEKDSQTGYDIILFLRKRFGKTLSSGTVYNTIYAIERKGLIKSVTAARKTSFTLTKKGEETLNIIQKSEEELRKFRLVSFDIDKELLR